MKVLHINTYDTGGAGKACIRIHNALLAEGVDSKVLVRNKSNGGQPEVYEIWEGLSTLEKSRKYLKQRRVDKEQERRRHSLGEFNELFSFPESIWDITKHPLYEWADIIHLHWVAGFVDYSSFFSKNNKKIVWTIHDEEPFSGGFHYPPTTDVTPFLGQIEQHLVLKSKVLANQDITIVSPSQYLADQSMKSSVFSGREHHVIKNCTNAEAYQFRSKEEARNSMDIPQDIKVILFVADDVNYERKGYALLKEAVEPILGETLKLYTVGNGKVTSMSEYHIHLRAIDSEEKMNQLYCSADLIVVPSLMDNLPNIISESLCSGSPVVATDVGGICEMIENYSTGLLSEPNAASFRKKIMLALSNDWDRSSISESSRVLYAGEFCAQAYFKVYNH